MNAYLQKRYCKETTIVHRKIAEEFILVPISRRAGDLDSIYTLNEVGARVWELLDGERSLMQIIECIIDEFEVCSNNAETDVAEFVQTLEQVGAVKTV
jgi:Coenzyme PQQ synthesis protein D (PqqD)